MSSGWDTMDMFAQKGRGMDSPALSVHMPIFARPERGGGDPVRHTVSLKQNHEFRRLYQKGKSAVSPDFAVYCRRNGRPGSRLGITTGVKLGNAVKRNFARRRIRELYRTNESKLIPGFDLVVVARTKLLFGRYQDVERSFLHLMKKLGLIATEGGEP